MDTYTLTLIDVTGIQNYIFGSNRLAENEGASHLVHEATTRWVRECLPAGTHNLLDDSDVTIDDSRYLEQDRTLDAEVILSGGGNVLILFRSEDLARQMVRRLTHRLIERAPGLDVVVAHQECRWDAPIGGKDGSHKELYRKLNQMKQQRHPSAPLLSLGVTLECRSTGLPAVGFTPTQGADDAPRPASAEVQAKLNRHNRDAVQRRFERMFAEVAGDYRTPLDFDRLGGTKDDMSTLAVVHADGNGMGKRFEQVIDAHPDARDNRDCLNTLRRLSRAVEQAGQAALKATVKRMTGRFESDHSEAMQTLLSGLWDRETKTMNLPFRPLVYGGDDITFVADGRLGLSLARIYLEEWEKVTAADPIIGPAYACAGVVVVKTHYPFVRAYQLAEHLCRQTKKQVRKAQCADASALDWHFAMSGIGGTIEQIREREYQGHEGSLYLRPVALQAGMFEPHWYNWAVFDRVVRTLQHDPTWQQRRNKVKQLREVLRKSISEIEHFRRAFAIVDLPRIDPSRPHLQTTGWDGKHCGYFDAIEALDFYLPLTEEG